MKKLFLYATLAIVAGVTILSSSCKKKEDPVPVVTITAQPTSPAAFTEGAVSGSLTVTAHATDGATLHYQWYSNTTNSNTGGTALEGATSAHYQLPATLTVGTHYYFCVVGATDAVSVRSSVATVTVNPAPGPVPVITITAQPTAPAGLTEGSIPANTQLTVAANVTESATLTYQWYSYGPADDEVFEPIDGATAATYTLPTDLEAGIHNYVCEISATSEIAVRTDVVTITVAEAGPVDSTELVGKWVAADNTHGIASVELSADGYYIVVVNGEVTRAGDEPQVYIGEYTVTENVATLQGFGTLTVLSLDGVNVIYLFELGTGETVEVNMEKASEIPSSPRTDLLCRTWICTRSEVSDPDTIPTDVGSYYFFSKAGTGTAWFEGVYGYPGKWEWKPGTDNELLLWVWDEEEGEWLGGDDQRTTLEKLTETELIIHEEDAWGWTRTWFRAAK